MDCRTNLVIYITTNMGRPWCRVPLHHGSSDPIALLSHTMVLSNIDTITSHCLNV